MHKSKFDCVMYASPIISGSESIRRVSGFITTLYVLGIKRGSPLNRVHAQTDRADLSILVYNPIHTHNRVTLSQYIIIHYTYILYTCICMYV